MLLVQFISLTSLLSVTFGRFVDVTDSKDHERNVVKKLTEKAPRIQVLYRTPDLEYIPYHKESIVKKIDDGELLWITPDKMRRSWTEELVPLLIHPDEQTVDVGKDDDVDDDRTQQKHEEDDESSTVKPTTTEPTIQASKPAAAEMESTEIELKMGTEIGDDLKSELTIDGTLDRQNVTEVYEEPFVRVYVKPLCEGVNC